MKILFTGASSFTGMWQIQALYEGGHELTAVFPRNVDEYLGLKKERVDRVLALADGKESAPFGSEAFLDIIKQSEGFDLFCHHAADVYDYKNQNFDFTKALANNTNNLRQVIENLKDKGCRKILLTGSVFEQGEGEGSDFLRAVSPYGLSKGLTSDVFNYFSQIYGMRLGKFVIPNPFGPLEDPRFTTYLAKSWIEGKTPKVSAPEYVRDNIPVSLLSKAYLHFAESLSERGGVQQCNPSYFAMGQGEFSHLFAKEMEKRLQLPCHLVLEKQTDFSEPLIRINSEKLDPARLSWNETAAWDELALYYQTTYGATMASSLHKS